ncbi:MAG: alpha/beta hydrolase [Flavobacteriales bacterium]|nr:alpha/beta hydrolase [Flavobacteriales bacterium]
MSQHSILLLHGALGSEAQFNSLKKELSNSFDVHSFSFEGHGGRASNRPFRIENGVENVLEYMESHKLERVSIFGYSMGGYVGLLLAGMHPNRVDRIMTLGTKLAWSPEFSAQEVRKLNPEKIEEKVPRFAQFLEKVHAPLDWKKVVQDTADMMIDLGEKRPLDDYYSTIMCPTLIALGSLDNMSTEEESKVVAEKLPNGEFQLIPDLEHPIEKVDASLLAEMLLKFMKS